MAASGTLADSFARNADESVSASQAKLRVLHVIQSLGHGYGGPSAAVIGMCRAVSLYDIEAEIYATNVDVNGYLRVPLAERIVVEGVSATFFPIQGPKGHFRFSWQFALRLARDTRRFDVLHIHSLYNFPGLIAAYFGRRHGVPYIVRPHGTLDPYHYRQRRMFKAPYEALFERRNLVHAAAVHFTSDEELRLAQRTGWSFRGVVMPLGVDLPPADSGARAMANNLWPQCKGRRIVLFLGRVDEKKGLDFLIPAFASLTHERPDLHLLVAGPENDRYGRKVRGWVRDWRIENRVTFAGMLTGDAKQCALGAASIFVLPSRGENFGVAVVEAMAAGLPVIVSEHVNIAPAIVGADAGVVVPLQVAPLSTAMAALLDDSDRAFAMGRKARQLVRAEFSWEQVGPRLAELYRSVVRAAPSA